MLTAPLDVILDDATVVQPDVVYVSQARKAIISARGIEGAPDLAIEVLSPATESLDRGRKAQLYFEHGVQEYWLIDPPSKTLERYVRGDAAFSLAQTFAGGDTLTTPLLPGFALPVQRLFPKEL